MSTFCKHPNGGLLCGTQSLTYIHVTQGVSPLLLSAIQQSPMVWQAELYVHSVMNRASVDIHAGVFMGMWVPLLWDKYPGVELLAYMGNAYLIFKKLLNYF